MEAKAGLNAHRPDGAPDPAPAPDSVPEPGHPATQANRFAGRPSGPRASAGSNPLGGNRQTRSLVIRIVALGFCGLAIYVVLPSLVKVIDAWPRLARASPIWMIGALIAEIVSFTFAFTLQRLALRTKGWFAVVTSGLAGNALTNVLPAGDAAGASLQYGMLATAGIDIDTAVGGLAAASLLGLGGLLSLPLFTLPAVLGATRVQPGLLHATLIGLAGFCLFIIFSTVALATEQPLRRLGFIAQWLWNKLRRPKTLLTGLDSRLLEQRDEIRSALGRQWRRAVFFVVGRLGFDYLCLLCVLRAIGSHARPSLVLLAYATAGVIALIPITPGGLGIVEAGLSGMLVLAGVSAAEALIATLGYRLASYWLPLPTGFVAFALFRRRYGPVQLPDTNHNRPRPRPHEGTSRETGDHGD